MTELHDLLDALDPDAPMPQRHLWLVHVVRWIRGDGQHPQASVERLRLLLDVAQVRPEFAARLQRWWQLLLGTVDVSILLADFGFAPRTSFTSELGQRLRQNLLPGTPETTDAAELFELVWHHPGDPAWLAGIDAGLAQRVASLLCPPSPAADTTGQPGTTWVPLLMDAITYGSTQVCVTGYAPEVRQRMSDTVVAQRPFHALADTLAELGQLARQPETTSDALAQAATTLGQRLDDCRHAASTVYTHLQDHGISVGLVFRLRQLRERVLRLRALLDALTHPQRGASAVHLLLMLAKMAQARRSVPALVAANASLLAAKVVERSAETGEHYITRDRTEYRAMLRHAAGGGALTALTVWLKFSIVSWGLVGFWLGWWSGINYALSFVLIQLLHFTLATKQPAATAPAMAARLKNLGDAGHVEAFVDEVTHLVRSQVAAVLGNVGLVVPATIALSLALLAGNGQHMLSTAQAHYVLHSLHPAGPTLLFAAFTGVLLFASSLVAGWAENAWVFYRLDSALRHNPRITHLLGPALASRVAGFLRRHISGLAGNISLGLMLGLVPAVLAFVGLGLDVRHVTLSAGQLAAAAASLGTAVLQESSFWWCVLSIPLIGLLNVSVSFVLAMRMALRAHNLSQRDRSAIHRAIRTRLRQRTREFFVPARDAVPPHTPPQLPPPAA